MPPDNLIKGLVIANIVNPFLLIFSLSFAYYKEELASFDKGFPRINAIAYKKIKL
jgi:hypothetical protein